MRHRRLAPGRAAIGGTTWAKRCAVCGKIIAAPKVARDTAEVCGRACAEEYDRRWVEAAPPGERALRVRCAAEAAVLRAKAAGEDVAPDAGGK